jgi:hypothetical protein
LGRPPAVRKLPSEPPPPCTHVNGATPTSAAARCHSGNEVSSAGRHSLGGRVKPPLRVSWMPSRALKRSAMA